MLFIREKNSYTLLDLYIFLSRSYKLSSEKLNYRYRSWKKRGE